ncbi:MAG: MFS transporter [Vicinamibacterales bacterium]
MISARAIWAIGVGQLVNWGVLYYAFGVLLVPVEQSLGAPRWLVAGAFSLGLLVSAIAAPAVGRLADRGQGPVVMQAGGLIAAGLLIAWAVLPSIWTTYAVWSGLGLCMAAILYEPVFAIVGRAFRDADDRLRAIATVTVMGGLASTAFLPGTTFLVGRLGWQGATIALAIVIASTTLVVSRLSFRDLTFSRSELRDAVFGRDDERSMAVPAPSLNRFVAGFALSSIVNSALASNIVAALIERRLTPSRAAFIGGLFGVMQLPGRVLMTNKSFTPGPFRLLFVSFALQIVGLLALTADGSQAAMWLGVTVFACGAGLTTLARPYLVLHVYGAERAGEINGAIARGQQLARSAGPVSAAALATVTGYSFVFAALAALLVAAMAVTPRSSR